VIPARPLRDPAVRRIALVRLRVGMGDLLASVPALRALRAARPDAEVVLITWPETAPVVERMAAYVDELLPFPGYPGIPERPPDLDGLERFLAATRRRRFDLAVQMYGGQPSANEVTIRIGARRTAGFFTPGAWPADPATHLPYPHRAHEIDRHLALVEFLGAGAGSRDLEFPLTAGDRAEAGRVLAADEVGPYAVVHPGATAASRRWLPERFGAVGDALARRGLGVVVTGVTGEEDECGRTAAAMTAPVANLVGATGLGGFAALVAGATLLVTNDSGPTQLAAALGTPSVTIYLAGDPQRWAPFDRRRHRAVQAGVGCQPCPHQTCPIDHRCATGVSVERVVAEVDALLRSRPGVGTAAAPAP
jgi:ADP-heptose:LPS heptosyltransferase